MWDYPRPPAVVADNRLVQVSHQRVVIATTTQAIRILETSHPPSFYVPPTSVTENTLQPVPGNSHCEWKGQAQYLALGPGERPIGWRYLAPYPDFAPFAGYVSFYPDAVQCLVGGEAVEPQEGGFYGGWITSEIVGPFKGSPGSSGW